MKKFLMVLVVTMLLFCVSGQAMAYFEDGHLIRAVYQLGGQYEVLTDLGAFSPTIPYAGATLSFTADPFPPAGSGIFNGASWGDLQVAYFVKKSLVNGFPAKTIWTSGQADGQTSGTRKFTSFESGAQAVYVGAKDNASGTAQATLLQSDLQSYVTQMDLGDPTINAGYFSQFIPLKNGETNLAALGTGSSYVDSYLYYYATPDSALAGLQVANIRTYADGHSEVVPVNNSVATHFTVSAPASAKAGTVKNFTVTALDDSEDIVTGYAGTVHFTSTDAAATLPLNSTLTSGTGTFQATLKTAGKRTIAATDTVSSSITGTSSDITVNAAAATHFTVSAPASAKAGTAFNVTVKALDQFNNKATGYAGTVHFTSTDAAATLPANSTLTSGTGTFQATLKTAGKRTITATDTVSSSITGTSSDITVNAAAATHFTVSAPASAKAGTAFNVTVKALDQFNNKATGYAGTVHFTSTDAAATLPPNSTLTSGAGTFQATLKTVGKRTITATDTVSSSITGASGDINVSAAAATHFTVSAPVSATAGAAKNFTVTARDQFNNKATGYAGTVHFTSSDAAATLPPDSTLTSGAGTFQATLRTVGSRTITATDTVTASINGTSNAINVQ